MEENPIVKGNSLFLKKKYILGIIILAGILIAASIIGFNKYEEYNTKNFDVNIAEAEQNFNMDKFSEAKQYYQTALKYKMDNSVQTKVQLSDDLEASLKNFNNGTELFDKKDYLGAYTAFKKVIPQDEKRFNLAKDKIAESSKLYIDGEFEQAKDSASKADYQKAIDSMSSILSIDANNVNAKTLQSQYQSDLQNAEKERQRKEAELAKQKKIDNARSLIRVIRLYTSEPNSVGGVDLHIIWRNNSNKTIKYIRFSVTPYNAVGDPQSSEIGGTSSINAKVTGPINPGITYGEGYLWECAWYNNTITTVKLNGIEITYMDDSTASLNQDQVQYAIY